MENQNSFLFFSLQSRQSQLCHAECLGECPLRSRRVFPVAQPGRAFPVQSGTKVLIFDVIAKSFLPHCPVPSKTPALKLSSRNETRTLALATPFPLGISALSASLKHLSSSPLAIHLPWLIKVKNTYSRRSLRPASPKAHRSHSLKSL